MTISPQTVMDRLGAVKGPDLQSDIVSLGLVSEIFIAGGKVFFSITVPPERADELESLRAAAERAVSRLPGVEAVVVALTAEKRGGGMGEVPRSKQPPPRDHASRHDAQSSRTGKIDVPGVNFIVAVASGKGGVGKSTIAVNLALGLYALGLKVGILDADIYGPSIPKLLGLCEKPEVIDGKLLKPIQAYGLKAMSIGFLVEQEEPIIWRGPMVTSALRRLLRGVAWAPLDVLIVDMPPGTGDTQITMAQQAPLAGAVIVSTPQDLALIDARKGLGMFRRVDVPILGIVENMTYFIAPDTGKRYDIFGHGGAKAEAERLGVPFLGEIPLTISVRESSDAGMPLVVSDPEGDPAKTYRAIAEKVLKRLMIEDAESADSKTLPA